MYTRQIGKMTLKKIQKDYPLHETLVGFYDNDQIFEVNKFEDIKDIDQWEYAPLDWGEGAMPFIRYKNNQFECWAYCYERVCGYYINEKTCKLVTFSNDFGYEVLSPNTKNYIIITPDIKQFGSLRNASKYENMIELVAKKFDKEAYKAGHIFTTYDDLKVFISNLEKK